MPSPVYTVLVVPERSAAVRRYTLPRRRLVQAGFVGLVALALAVCVLVHYVWLLHEAAQIKPLRQKNAELVERVRLVQAQLGRIDATLQRIDSYTARIRGMAQLHDPGRYLAMAAVAGDVKAPGVLYASGERIDSEDEAIDSRLAQRLMRDRIEQTQNAAAQAEELARQTNLSFSGAREVLLATTPSIRPVRSHLLTYGFGMRVDPYTERRVLHKGVDFAAEQGAQVVAPADGRVVFAGNRGNGYGQTVVLHHGFGVQTHFSHLHDITVTPGQALKRGETLGTVGNSGRSSVAHLHYEVRLEGMPTDPMPFILE